MPVEELPVFEPLENTSSGFYRHLAIFVAAVVVFIVAMTIGFMVGRTSPVTNVAVPAAQVGVVPTTSASLPPAPLPTAAPTTTVVTTPPTTVVDPATLDAEEGHVLRLYLGVFGRPPDREGQVFWSAQLRGGRPLLEVAEGILESGEFDAEQADEATLSHLYLNIFDREPDAGGRAFWLDRRAGTSLTQFVLDFVNTPEALEATGTQNPVD